MRLIHNDFGKNKKKKKLLICTTAAVLHTPALRFAPGFFTVVRISPFCLIADQGCLKEIFDCFFQVSNRSDKTAIRPLVHCGLDTVRDFFIKFGIKPLMHGWK